MAYEFFRDDLCIGARDCAAVLQSFGQWDEGHPIFSAGACISFLNDGRWKMINCGQRLSTVCDIRGISIYFLLFTMFTLVSILYGLLA